MVDNNQLSDQGVVLEIVVMEPQPTELSWVLHNIDISYNNIV